VKAVILAAGKGTRLRQLTANRPKPMVKVGNSTALERIMGGIAQAGIREFVLVVGYRKEVIERYFGDGARFGVKIHYVHQQVQNGTGSAVHLTREVVGEEPFLLSFGDIIVPPDNYQAMTAAYSSGADAVLALNWVADPYKGAAVYLDENDVVKEIVEKPPKGTAKTNWNNAGIFLFSPLIFQYTAALTPSVRGEYELPQAIGQMIADGRKVIGLKLQGYWGDIGTPEELEQMQHIVQDAHSV
jgi:NDP-sugar pyrophosphorylase family protein